MKKFIFLYSLFLLIMMLICAIAQAQAPPTTTVPVDIPAASFTLPTAELKGAKGDTGATGAAGKDGVTTIVYVSGAAKLQGNTFYCYTGADVDSAMLLARTGKVLALYIQVTDIARDIICPIEWVGNSRTLYIQGNGMYLNGKVDQDPITNFAQSQSSLRGRITIENLSCKSIHLSCIYNPTIHNCRFSGAQIGVRLQYCLNAEISHNDFVSCAGDILLDTLRLPDCPHNDCINMTGCNNAMVFDNRFNNSNSVTAQKYAILNRAGSNLVHFHNEYEGNHFLIGVSSDDLNGNTTKNSVGLYEYTEAIFDSATYQPRYKAGSNFTVQGLWAQKVGLVIDGLYCAGTIKVSEVPFFASSPPLRSSKATIWDLQNNKQIGFVTDTTVTGKVKIDPTLIFGTTVPDNYSIQCTFQNRWYMVNPKLLINYKAQP